jgi:hypothetical protein
MIKLNRYSYFLMGLMGLLVVSCNNNDDVDKSVITSFEKFTFTELPTALVVPESDETYTFNFGFDEKQIINVTVDIAPTDESTATEGSDFDLSTHSVSVSAFEGGGQFDITVHADQIPEGNETVVLSFTPHDPTGLPLPAESLVLTIRDSIYPTGVQVSWECPFADIDLFLVDGNGDFAGGFGGATAACPESMIAGGLADGDYSIVVNLYESGLFGTGDEGDITMGVLLFKGGLVPPANATIKYNTGDFAQVPLWDETTPSDPDGEALEVIGVLRVSGGKVTLLDPSGANVGQL